MARASVESRGTPYQGVIPKLADTAQWGVKFSGFRLPHDGLVTDIAAMLRVHFPHNFKSAAFPVGFPSTAHALDDDCDEPPKDPHPPLGKR